MLPLHWDKLGSWDSKIRALSTFMRSPLRCSSNSNERKVVAKGRWSLETLDPCERGVALRDGGGTTMNGVVIVDITVPPIDVPEGNCAWDGAVLDAGGAGGSSVGPVAITRVAMTTTCAVTTIGRPDV